MKKRFNLDGTPKEVYYNLDGTTKPPSFDLEGGIKIENRYIGLDGEYLEETVNLDRSPNFRQNGHELSFESSNSDYLSFTNPTQINTIDQISFKVTTSNMGGNAATWQLFSVGTTVVSNGLLSIWLLSSGLIILDVYDDTGSQVVNVNGGTQSNLDDLIEWSFDGVKLYRDGVQIIDLTSFGTINVNISTSSLATIGRLSYLSSRFGNMTVNNFEYLSETFNPIDIDSNAQIEGSSGTVATVNTSRTGGGIIEADDNYLTFDSANGDYLRTSNFSLTKISDITFKQKLNIDFNVVELRGLLSFGVGGNYFFLYVSASNRITIEGFSDDGVNFFTQGSVINGDELLEFDGGKLYLNGVVDIDLTSFGQLNFVSNSPSSFYLSRAPFQSARYYTGIIEGFELMGKTFNLREGQGTTITSEDGTATATINTSHASGTYYINNDIWSNDRWSPEYYKLDEVFQKTSFALEFESANSEYLEDTTQTGTLTNTDEIDIDIDFTVNDWLGASGAQGIIAIGSSTNYFYVSKWVSDNQILVSVISGATSYTRGFTITPQTKNKLRINGGQMFFNGVEFGAGTGFNNQAINIDKSIVRFGARSVDTTTTLSGVIYPNPIVQGVNYPLTEGLGNTTNGGTISTSHADGIDRINWGMWQKNGNVLEFDAANSDYLGLSESVVNGDKLTFDLTFNGGSGDNQYIFSGGGSFRSYFVDGVGQLTQAGCTLDKLYIDGVDSPLNTDLQQNYGAKLRLEYTVNGSFTLNYIGSFSDSAWFSNTTISSFVLANKTFQLREGYGTTTTSEEGAATATINTGRTGGGIVGSTDNYLQFESANSDYLEGDINDIITNLSEINFSVNFKTPSDLTGNQQILTISVTTPSLFSLYCANGVLVALIIDSGNNVVSIGSTYSLNVDTDYIIDFDGTNLYVNENIEYTVTDPNLKLINIDNSDVFRFNQYRGTRYSDFTLYSLTVLGTNYLLTEGLGNTTNGATINTSHASGAYYIDNNIWSNDEWTTEYYVNENVWDKSHLKWLPFKE